jgi:hypothetical protein
MLAWVCAQIPEQGAIVSSSSGTNVAAGALLLLAADRRHHRAVRALPDRRRA